MNDSVDVAKAGFSFDSLEAIRRKLLDLTARNSLLAYKHPRASCVRLIDELPNQIMESLLEGNSLTFIPVPEPTEKELIQAGYIRIDPETKKKSVSEYPTATQWAKYLNFNIQYDLPHQKTTDGQEQKHTDKNLQTLFYAPELEARLRSIKGKADTAIDECGSNILYLVIGFLEWFESAESEVSRVAPLFTLPVQLKRANLDANMGAYRYTIELKDDGILTNVTLQQKLSADFGLILPEIQEDILPETYFELIAKTILQHKPRWSIKRNITLGLLDFAKQAMYQDLDPANWPADNNIKDHPIIQNFFSSVDSEREGSLTTYATEHAIDSVPDIHSQYPIIYEADSSQHSAIIDAVKGDNLVIEGPPGSGKSQTITNLIAASLAQGKSVLFVAEKMAALNVVKSRLDQAGLGDFCLELHSHKTNKLQILNDLSQRLDNQDKYTNPRLLDVEIKSLEANRERLNDYVQLINSNWKNTGLSLHDIFNRATRYRKQFELNPESLQIPDLTGESCDELRQKTLYDQADMLKDIYVAVSKQTATERIEDHYWFGVNNIQLNDLDSQKLISHLDQWTDSLDQFYSLWVSETQSIGLNSLSEDFDQIASVLKDIRELPELVGSEPLGELKFILLQSKDFKSFIESYVNIHTDYDQLSTRFKKEFIRDISRHSGLREEIEKLEELGINPDDSFSKLANDFNTVKSLHNQCTVVHKTLDEIKSRLPAELYPVCDMTESGIKEFKTFINIVQELPADLWKHRDLLFDNTDLDPIIDQLKPKLRQLVSVHKILQDHYILDKLPSVDELIGLQNRMENTSLVSYFSKTWWLARKQLRALSKFPNTKTHIIRDALTDMISYAKGLAEIEKINAADSSLGVHFKGIETPIDRISGLRQWYKKVRLVYAAGFGSRAAIGNALFSLDKELAMAIAQTAKQDLLHSLDTIDQELKKVQSIFPNYLPLFDRTVPLSGPQSPLKKLLLALHQPLSAIKDAVSGSSNTIANMRESIDILNRWVSHIADWNSNPCKQKLVPKYYDVTLEAFMIDQEFVKSATNTLLICNKLASLPALASALIESANPFDRYRLLKNLSPDLDPLAETVTGSRSRFVDLGMVSVSDWVKSSTSAIQPLIARNRSAVSNKNWLITWVDYIRTRNRLSGQGLSNLINGLESNAVDANSLRDVVHLVVYDQLAKEALRENPALSEFSGLEQMAIRKKYQEYDQNIQKLQRRRIAYKASRKEPPIGNSSGRVSTYTETSLILHEANKKTRHISVRSLLKGAGTSIRILKPCFMMSPMSVAQYLNQGDFTFDLVVMDEASQIRPEDALGAIARGKSVVIVGDPKQLPPTSFFQRSIEVEDSDDNVALEEAESILDTVVPMFKNRRLRWHYRSRHESLIAFSNKYFYDENLVLFPSPFQSSDEFGIKFHRVSKGRFVGRRNIEEAKDIVDHIAQHLLKSPDESIGVVAMNSEQRDEIEKQFEQLRKENSQVRFAFERNELNNEPLFIKNLENVQGDERDVIVISLTYGPEQIGGKTMQRFGPINSDAGWRRLNVLFTRSKKRMHIFSSMTSSDVIVGSSSKRGVNSLRAFLEYCESGHLHHTQHTGKPADSDFEIAVMRELYKHGYECEPQLGVAGFFLDLAVIDPGKKGRFLLGIECDGATYHSAKSTRDRDRLRQEILEDLGWTIRRIWSTDWYKNPQAQLQPILNELDKLRTPVTEIEQIPEATVEIIEQSELHDVQPLDYENDNLSLRDRLVLLNEQVIKVEFPHTPEESRLLRPSMVEALLSKKPISKSEFFENIPEYIRKGTSPSEGKYLDSVLELIADFGLS